MKNILYSLLFFCGLSFFSSEASVQEIFEKSLGGLNQALIEAGCDEEEVKERLERLIQNKEFQEVFEAAMNNQVEVQLLNNTNENIPKIMNNLIAGIVLGGLADSAASFTWSYFDDKFEQGSLFKYYGYLKRLGKLVAGVGLLSCFIAKYYIQKKLDKLQKNSGDSSKNIEKLMAVVMVFYKDLIEKAKKNMESQSSKESDSDKF